MTRRWTSIGSLLASDREEGVRQIAEAIRENGGNVRRTAFMLDIGQPWLCVLIVRHNLQGVVQAARKLAARPDWLTRARRILAMDEQIQAIAHACAGMSEDDIVQLIMSSANADAFQDPGLVAAYIVSLGSAS